MCYGFRVLNFAVCITHFMCHMWVLCCSACPTVGTHDQPDPNQSVWQCTALHLLLCAKPILFFIMRSCYPSHKNNVLCSGYNVPKRLESTRQPVRSLRYQQQFRADHVSGWVLCVSSSVRVSSIHEWSIRPLVCWLINRVVSHFTLQREPEGVNTYSTRLQRLEKLHPSTVFIKWYKSDKSNHSQGRRISREHQVWWVVQFYFPQGRLLTMIKA